MQNCTRFPALIGEVVEVNGEGAGQKQITGPFVIPVNVVRLPESVVDGERRSPEGIKYYLGGEGSNRKG